MKKVLVTGGCGFVGAHLALKLKQDYPSAQIISFDSLHRQGSELNLPRLRDGGVVFIHGDIRNPEDFEAVGGFDLLVECSAEPSVLAGYSGSPLYLYKTNLDGCVNCLDLCRRYGASILFLSTSRVYPMDVINRLRLREDETRFHIDPFQAAPGVSEKGVNEKFPLDGIRSLYGATKLCAELMIGEYIHAYGIKGVINRCGVIAGPWQMGKVDQGFVVLWVARHLWNQRLSYIGYGGKGKQVRDILHIDDLYRLILLQIEQLDELNGSTFNVGGGMELSVSLCELTEMCRRLTGNRIEIEPVPQERVADIPYYVSDCSYLEGKTGWRSQRGKEDILIDICAWLRGHESLLKGIIG